MRKVLLAVLLVLAFSHTVMASPDKWVDKGYNFKVVKSVLLLEPACTDNTTDDVGLKQIKQVFLSEAEMKNVKMLHEEDIVAAMDDKTKENYNKLLKDDADGARKILLQQAQKSADIAVYTTVTAYHSGTKHIAESIKTYTDYQQIEMDTPQGKQKVKYPVTRTEVIPAHDITTLTSDTQFKAIDLKTGKDVMMITDHRYRELGTYDSSSPDHMLKRGINSFFSVLYKLIK